MSGASTALLPRRLSYFFRAMGQLQTRILRPRDLTRSGGKTFHGFVNRAPGTGVNVTSFLIGWAHTQSDPWRKRPWIIEYRTAWMGSRRAKCTAKPQLISYYIKIILLDETTHACSSYNDGLAKSHCSGADQKEHQSKCLDLMTPSWQLKCWLDTGNCGCTTSSAKLYW